MQNRKPDVVKNEYGWGGGGGFQELCAGPLVEESREAVEVYFASC